MDLEIIGGADGPTAVVAAHSGNIASFIFGIVIGAAAVAAAAVIVHAVKKRKK